MSYHLKLLKDLSQGPESCEGDRGDQEEHGFCLNGAWKSVWSNKQPTFFTAPSLRSRLADRWLGVHKLDEFANMFRFTFVF